MGESFRQLSHVDTAKYASGRQHQARLLMELRDVTLSSQPGRTQENMENEIRNERTLQRLERMARNELCAQPHLERHHLGERDKSVVQTFQRLATHDDTYLPEEENPPPDYISNSVLESEIASLNMTLFHHCPSSCQCQCHIEYRLHTPTWLRPVLGQMLLQYNFSLLMRRPNCDRPGCVSRDSNSICFQFYMPRWLLPRAILASLTWDCGVAGPGASLYLRVPRVFEFDCGINMGLIAGNITVLQQKIATGVLRPTDVDSLSGETVLTVSGLLKSRFTLIRRLNLREIQYAIRHGHPKIWHALFNLGFDAGLKDLGSGR